MKRTALKRKTPMKRSAALPERSHFIRSRNRGRARPKEPLAVFCERCQQAPATDRHHILRRSAGGTDERENTRDLCRDCHMHIHRHPTQSYAEGWLVRRGAA